MGFTINVALYDGSFEGFLSVVFEKYERKLVFQKVVYSELYIPDLYNPSITITSNSEKAIRVLNGIIKKSNRSIANFIYKCFLSEQEGIELKLIYLIDQIFIGNTAVIKDYGDLVILDLHQTVKKINREVHRMHAFVRFQELLDDTFIALVVPDFNVLPLLPNHFKKRYPSFSWMIYDVKRSYSLKYEAETRQISFTDFVEPIKLKDQTVDSRQLSEMEVQYQTLWKTYFKSVNIEERNNKKLHLQHVPKRYWNFLIEKR